MCKHDFFFLLIQVRVLDDVKLIIGEVQMSPVTSDKATA